MGGAIHNEREPGAPLTPDEERIVCALLQALRRIDHRLVQVMVQDRRVIQIDTLEKTRFTFEGLRP